MKMASEKFDLDLKKEERLRKVRLTLGEVKNQLKTVLDKNIQLKEQIGVAKTENESM